MVETHMYYDFCVFYGPLNVHSKANENLLSDIVFSEVLFDSSVMVFGCNRVSNLYRVGVTF